jgi:hypothetical protein
MATITGTKYNDRLRGTSGSDLIKGGAGNDQIDGGAGFDTAVYLGSFWDYTFARNYDGSFSVTDTKYPTRDGTDTLRYVEALQFGDITIRLDKNNAPITQTDNATTTEDSKGISINVLANDKDFEGNTFQISKIAGQSIWVGKTITLASGATVTLNADQTLTYNPNKTFDYLDGGQSKIDKFTYVTTDSKGASSAPTAVNVTVKGLWEAPIYISDGTVSEAGQKPGTNDIINSIGVTADHFGLVRALDAGIELGLQVTYRQGGDPRLHTDLDGYGDGELHFSVNEGPQSVLNGSDINRDDRASWSFEFSIVTGLNGETTNLDSFVFKLLYDVDPSANVYYQTLVLEPGGTGTSGHSWRAQDDGKIVIAGDDGNAYVTQNGENYAFDFFQEDLKKFQNSTVSPYGEENDFAAPAEFDIVLQAFDKWSTPLAENHIVVNVIEPPNPYATA